MGDGGTADGNSGRTPKLNLANWFSNFQLDKIRLGPNWANVEITFAESDRDAAWELYIEMLTRIVTQPLPFEAGDEKTALDSVYSLFATTRMVLRQRGRSTIQVSKVAIPVLNQVVRPFTAKWHKESLAGVFNDGDRRQEFREELSALRGELRNYNRMLAKIAGVEDLTELEQVEGG